MSTSPTTTTAATSAEHRPARRSTLLLGALPFIGVILFAVDAVQVAFGGPDAGWRQELFESAVTYMIGWAGIGAAVAHIAFGSRTSRSIGWAASPFEFEVGLASLAMGVAGLMANGQPLAFAWGVIVVNAIFRIGCGVGHVRDMVRNRNFALNNTSILFINFAVPAFLIWAYQIWA